MGAGRPVRPRTQEGRGREWGAGHRRWHPSHSGASTRRLAAGGQPGGPESGGQARLPWAAPPRPTGGSPAPTPRAGGSGVYSGRPREGAASTRELGTRGPPPGAVPQPVSPGLSGWLLRAAPGDSAVPGTQQLLSVKYGHRILRAAKEIVLLLTLCHGGGRLRDGAGEWGAGPLTPGCPLGWRREGPNQGPLHLADPSTMGQGCFTWGRRGDRQARWDSPSDSEAALKIR